MAPDVLAQLLVVEAEAQGLELDPGSAEVTPELERVVDEYEDALHEQLLGFVQRESRWPRSEVEDFVGGLMDEGAPYLVLMTLRGEGAGIWDGSWDQYFTDAELKRLQAELVRSLGAYADVTGGGSVNDALRHAAAVAAGQAPPSNGHGGNGISYGGGWMLYNPIRHYHPSEPLEFWEYEHRTPPDRLDDLESYVRAIKFVVQDRPRKIEAVERDVERIDRRGFHRQSLEVTLAELEDAGVLDISQRGRGWYVQRTRVRSNPTGRRRSGARYAPSQADVIVTRLGRETGVVPQNPEADRYLAEQLHLDYDRYYGAYMPFEDEVDDVMLALRMRGYSVDEQGRPDNPMYLLRPPLSANQAEHAEEPDVVAVPAGDLVALIPRTEEADQYIAERLSIGHAYAEDWGGYMATPAELNETLAFLAAAGFEVQSEPIQEGVTA